MDGNRNAWPLVAPRSISDSDSELHFEQLDYFITQINNTSKDYSYPPVCRYQSNGFWYAIHPRLIRAINLSDDYIIIGKLMICARQVTLKERV